MIKRSLLSGLALAGILSAAAVSAQTATPAMTDGQIVAYVQAVNAGEIADGKMALRRGKGANVKSFANQMVKDHSASEKTMKSLAGKLKLKMQTSDVTTALKTEAAQGDKELKATKAGAFDKAYIDAQAKMHGEVADTIQQRLMPAASNDTLKSALTDTLATVQAHLKMAQDMSAKMQ